MGEPLDCYLVIPCYRESERLPGFLQELCQALEQSKRAVRVRVVDDGSGEPERRKVEETVRRLQASYSFLDDVLALPENQGKGGAIRSGWRERPHPCRYLGFIDADGAVRPSGFLKVLQKGLAAEGAALVVGSRRVPGGAVKRDWSRRVLSAAFSLLTRFSYRVDVSDTQCGCKLVAEEWYRTIESELVETGFALDIELLWRARRAGRETLEVGVDWEEQSGSKVSWSGGLELARDVFLRRIGSRGGD